MDQGRRHRGVFVSICDSHHLCAESYFAHTRTPSVYDLQSVDASDPRYVFQPTGTSLRADSRRIVISPSDRQRILSCLQWSSFILPDIFLYRIFRHLCKQPFHSCCVVSTQDNGQVVGSFDAPVKPPSLHPVSDQGKHIAFHASEPRMMQHARFSGRRNLYPSFVVACKRLLVLLVVIIQFLQS